MKITGGLENGQVLQRLGKRGANAEISLDAVPGRFLYVTISNQAGPLRGWRKRRFPVRNAKVRLTGLPAGGPYRLELLAGDQCAIISSFFVGDVWLMAGQSNMQGCGHMANPGRPHPLIRVFTMRREWRLAKDPLHVRDESPDACHHKDKGRQFTREEAEAYRKTTTRGVGLGLFFAREMLERTGVPQGLLATAHGGTTMDQWSPARKKEGGKSLYASMVASVKATGQPVAGLLWYQGESDITPARAQVYTQNMVQLVRSIRRDLKQSKLPVIAVQIATVHRPPSPGEQEGWKSVQEQQRLLPQRIPHLEVVAAVDLVMDDHIHISGVGHARLGPRLARCADFLVHRNRKEGRPPQFKKISVPKMRPGEFAALDVHFDHVAGKLHADSRPTGFAICDLAGKNLFLIFKTTLRGNIVRLHLPYLPPLNSTLCYGPETGSMCNITDGRDYALPVFGPIALNEPLALLPFLTHWKVTDVQTGKSLAVAKIPKANLFSAKAREYREEGFVNEHSSWFGKSGQCYFQTRLKLPEAMKLKFLMGYDGPFRLWVNRKPIFQNLQGTNPCSPDESRKSVSLPAGVHEVCIGMDLNGGIAWGFFLRLARTDVPAAQLASGNYLKPIYLDA